MNYANCVWCFDYNESALVMTIALSRYTIIGAMVADTSLLRFDTWLYLYIAFQMMKAHFPNLHTRISFRIWVQLNIVIHLSCVKYIDILNYCIVHLFVTYLL